MDYIVYHIRNSRQFWSELNDIVTFPPDVTLKQLDAALETFISLCANYHENFLKSRAHIEQACRTLLKSELFTFHSGRSSEAVLKDAKSNTNPHAQFILYHILLHYGRRQPTFFKSVQKWQSILPLLMDHLLVEIDENAAAGLVPGLAVPIEARLRLLSVQLIYEVCHVQKLDMSDLRIFDDAFIGHLFDLVEQTRSMPEEELNYSLIKLIVALNEQFMVASIPPSSHHGHNGHAPHEGTPHVPPVGNANRVLEILLRRLGSSKTFGENMIFMLNRADGSPEALCMQLLILKMLYLLFTTDGAQEYFYTNDLCVLVDVFIRELNDLPEERESLRHTYLRVLYPLLTNTQLRVVPYKRVEIRRLLMGLIANAHIREVNSTTKRLVERCLSAPSLASTIVVSMASKSSTPTSPTSGSDELSPTTSSPTSTSPVEVLVPHVSALRLGVIKDGSINQSSASVHSVAAALPGSITRPRRASRTHSDPSSPPIHLTEFSTSPLPLYNALPSSEAHDPSSLSPLPRPHRLGPRKMSSVGSGLRSAPPTPPPKKRKPPAVPDRRHKYPSITLSSTEDSTNGIRQQPVSPPPHTPHHRSQHTHPPIQM